MSKLGQIFSDRIILLAVLVGFACYWMYGQVSNLEEQNALLNEEKTALMQVLSNQCTTFLTQQGMQVVPQPVPPAVQEPEDGEKPR